MSMCLWASIHTLCCSEYKLLKKIYSDYKTTKKKLGLSYNQVFLITNCIALKYCM